MLVHPRIASTNTRDPASDSAALSRYPAVSSRACPNMLRGRYNELGIAYYNELGIAYSGVLRPLWNRSVHLN